MNSTYATPSTGGETGGDPISAGVTRPPFGVQFGITAKLVVMVAVPLAALVFVLGLEIAERVSTQRDMQSLVESSALVSDAEKVVSAMAHERGISSLYLSSGGSLYRRELIGQWVETDAVLAAFTGTLTRLDADQSDRFFLKKYKPDAWVDSPSTSFRLTSFARPS